jgi:hypothetical protein
VVEATTVGLVDDVSVPPERLQRRPGDEGQELDLVAYSINYSREPLRWCWWATMPTAAATRSRRGLTRPASWTRMSRRTSDAVEPRGRCRGAILLPAPFSGDVLAERLLGASTWAMPRQCNGNRDVPGDDLDGALAYGGNNARPCTPPTPRP